MRLVTGRAENYLSQLLGLEQSVVVIRHKAGQLYKTTILRIVVVVAVKFKRPNDPPTANLIQLYFVHHRQFEIVPALNTRHVTCCRIDPIRQDTAILFLLNAVTSNKSPPDWPSSLRMGGQLYLKISQRLLWLLDLLLLHSCFEPVGPCPTRSIRRSRSSALTL